MSFACNFPKRSYIMRRPRSPTGVSCQRLFVMLVLLKVSNEVFGRPNVVRNLTVTHVTSSSVSLSWNAPEGESSFYRVEWDDSTGVMNETTDETSVNISGLTAGAKYMFRVYAPADNKTAGGSVNKTQYTKPNAVRNLTVTPITSSDVSLSWTGPEGESSFYRVEWDGSTGLMNKTTDQTSVNISGLNAGAKYMFRVYALAADNQTEGHSVNKTQYTKPKVVRILTCTHITSSSVSLSWNAPEGESSFYRVEWGDSTGVMNKTTDQTSVNISGLTAGAKYMFRVYALAADNQTAGDSVNKTQSTKPKVVRNLTCTHITPSSVSLSWNAPEGESSFYRVEWADSTGVMNKTTDQTSVNISGLTAGAKYMFRVYALAADNQTAGDSVNKTQYTKPKVVRNLTCTHITPSSVSLSWTAPEGESSFYRVEWDDSTGLMNKTTDQTSVNISGLTAGAKYTFMVYALAADNQTAGDSVNKTQYTKPKVVRNLTCTHITPSSVSLSWNAPEGESSFYRVEWADSTGVMNKTTDQTSVNISGLTAGAKYMFRVYALAADNQTAGDSVNKTQYTKPKVVRNLTCTHITPSSVSLSWTAPEGESSFYRVEWDDSTGLMNKTTDQTSVNISGLTAGAKYTFMVYALAADNQTAGDSVNKTQYTRPNVIRNLTVTHITSSSVSLSWTAPEGESSFYLVEWDGSTGVMNKTTDQTFVNISGLTAGAKYMFRVHALAADNQTAGDSVSKTQYTRPNVIRNLTVTHITSSSVSLYWEAPEGESSFYRVQWDDSTGLMNMTTDQTSVNISGLTAGAKYMFRVYALAADNQTAGDFVIKTQSTRPNVVRNLTVTHITSSSVSLSWTEPEGESSFYVVEWDESTGLMNKTTDETSVNISGLTSGVKYMFRVYALAADNQTAGDSVNKTQYTKPEKLTPTVLNKGRNDSITVLWGLPKGTVERYVVSLAGSDGMTSTKELNSSSQSHEFFGLTAGMLYAVKLNTTSGPFTEESEPVLNATIPNQPGLICLIKKTENSIILEWGEALGMVPSSFNYSVFYQPGGKNITTQINTANLSDLESETAYNVSVYSVGPLGLVSHAVRIQQVTRPKSVQSLKVTSISEDKITVQWKANSHSYEVVTTNYTKNTTQTRHEVKNLTPGTQYNFSVTPLAIDGTYGTEKIVSGCTDAARVDSVSCIGPNLTDAVLMLSWSKPRGANQGFEIHLNDRPVLHSNSVYSHNLTHLSYDQTYSVKIQTLSCGKASLFTEEFCKTGITVPPVPDTANVSITGKDHNTFTLQLDPKLFKNTSGPIKSYGVLVTSDRRSVSGGSTLLQSYLNKTYEDWKAEHTSAYLAVIKSMESGSRNGGNSPVVVIGDGSKLYSYSNGPLEPLTTYSFAVVTFTNLEISDGLVAIPRSFFSISEFNSRGISLPVNPVVVGGAVGGAVAVLVILVLATVILVAFWRRLSKRNSSEVPIYSIRAKVSSPIRVENYEAYYKENQADSNLGFADQYETLKPVGVAQARNIALSPENKGKNRYNNVLPYDSSRVKLSVQGSPHDDYINANYMPGYSSKKEFIAAQGPLPSTVNEFWRMVWEKNVHTLVMLTKCNEQGRVKCEKYWPSGTQHYSNITVTTAAEIPLEDWTIRDFSVKNVKTAETRTVRHFHFTAWPDHGVPETTELLINFRHLVREHMDEYSCHSPTVVHCSAGVGRTGTFIAIDRLIYQIEHDGMVDVYGIVHDLRMHRPLMVQTEDQFIFLNQCAMDIIRSRTGTNVDLIYQNTAALSIYENIEPRKSSNGINNA